MKREQNDVFSTGRSAQILATLRAERDEAKGAPKINTAAL
jgi:hypothetical protein